MKRLSRIQEALQQMYPAGVTPNPLKVKVLVNRALLTELADCLYYICFPECCSPPARVVPNNVKEDVVMEWVMGHAINIMTTQMTSAFVIHGDRHAVNENRSFEPLQTLEQTPDGPKGGIQPNENKFESLCLSAKKGCVEVAATDAGVDREFLDRCCIRAEAITTNFFVERFSHVRWLLHTDVEAILKKDVAATSRSEVILCYPAVHCMLYQRVAHQLYLLGVPMNFTRMLTEIAHSLTGVDIHPKTSIGHHFFLDHGTGTVVGATAILGNDVSLYQGVTLGAKSFPKDKKTGKLILNLPRHPIIKDGVTIYANAVVLGRITIGEGSTIGANCWVVQSIPPFSSIVQASKSALLPDKRVLFENDGSGI